MKRIAFALFAFALSLCALSMGAAAQSESKLRRNSTILPRLREPRDRVLQLCERGLVSRRVSGNDAGLRSRRRSSRDLSGVRLRRLINLAIGNTYIEETDVRLLGLSGGLTLKRTWNGMWPAINFQIGLFGPNWQSAKQVFVK